MIIPNIDTRRCTIVTYHDKSGNACRKCMAHGMDCFPHTDECEFHVLVRMIHLIITQVNSAQELLDTLETQANTLRPFAEHIKEMQE